MNRKPRTTIFRIILPVLCLFLVMRSAAQPFNLNDNIKPVELMLVDYKKDDPKAKGKINITEITQVQDTLYFFIKGFSMYSPAYFGITAEDHAAPIQVTLNKENWRQANKNGETDDKGHWETSFKTEGDFGIMVVPKTKPAKYTLVTWVGAEAKDVGVASPFSGTASGESGGFFKKYLWYMVGGIVVLLAILFFIFKRKKQ